MLAPQDFPPLKLCKRCNWLFNGADPIHRQIWHEKSGYQFTRTREELERAASKGCVFCNALASRDGRYKREAFMDELGATSSGELAGHDQFRKWGDEGGGQSPEDKSNANMNLWAHRPRPAWFPPQEEELQFQIKYNFLHNILYLYGIKGINWTGGDLSWNLHTISDDPASELVYSRAVLPEFDSSESFEDVQKWMEDCVIGHPECPGDALVDLPTRLVEVSPVGARESARLCYTQRKKGTYCALSYCWGGEQPFKTTRERYDAYLQSLPYQDLPQTIRDAFHVARNVGIQYVWIDSLCIIEDDEDDVRAEMAKMLQVYMNAHFTISAASASSCDQGFLQRRFDKEKGPFFLPVRVDADTMGSVLISDTGLSWQNVGANAQPINKRAWTLQEALRTPRLLIFTSMNVIWKCQSGSKPEVDEAPGVKMDRRRTGEFEKMKKSPWVWALNSYGYSFVSEESMNTPPSPSDDPPTDGSSFDVNLSAPVRRAWCSLVTEYTKRKLSVATDKLPAISAIAEPFALKLNSDYLAGMWRRYLVYDLMWCVCDWAHPGQCKSGSPSWSWAGVQGEIAFLGNNEVYATAEVGDCRVDLVSPEAPYGGVRGGELVIRGHFKELKLDVEGRIIDLSGKELPDADFSVDGGAETRLDFADISQAWCLTLGYAPVYQDGTGRKCYSLIVIADKYRLGFYRRVGFLQLRVDAAPFWWEDCEKVTITII
ncbi:Fc.00g080070.m01.CDS01 [Cosmosporella sp. VM-42]